MSTVNEAYGVLSDPARRAMYDAHHATIHIRVPEGYGETPEVSHVRRRRSNRDPGFTNTVLLVMSRLMRYVTAVLPL